MRKQNVLDEPAFTQMANPLVPSEWISDKYQNYTRTMNQQATFSELLRAPKEVLANINLGEIRITRRDAEDLVVLRASDLEHQQAGIALASQIMRALLRTGDAAEALTQIFAWTSELSESERAEYVTEISKLVSSAAELGRYELLLHAQNEWRETAAAYADGLTGREELQWLSTARKVPAP